MTNAYETLSLTGLLNEKNIDIFNTDDDRQELIGCCEKMLDECNKRTTQQPSATCSEQPATDKESLPPDSVGESDDGSCSIDPRNSFDNALRRAVLEEQQLKSAFYFDGHRFVHIQVVVEIQSGKCQLILPIDHPHHLGVPEEVPVFETKTVPIDEFKQ